MSLSARVQDNVCHCDGGGRAYNVQTSKIWNRQNLSRGLKIEHVSSTEAVSSTCSNWLARNWSAQNSWGEVCLYGADLDPCQPEELHFTSLPKPDSPRGWDQQRTWQWDEQ